MEQNQKVAYILIAIVVVFMLLEISSLADVESGHYATLGTLITTLLGIRHLRNGPSKSNSKDKNGQEREK